MTVEDLPIPQCFLFVEGMECCPFCGETSHPPDFHFGVRKPELKEAPICQKHDCQLKPVPDDNLGWNHIWYECETGQESYPEFANPSLRRLRK